MGFEITTQPKQTDLKVLFDQENTMFISDKELHAYVGKDEQDIKRIYQEVLNLAAQQSINSLEIPIMHHAGVSEIHVYPLAFEAIENFLVNHELDIYLNLEVTGFYNNSKKIEAELFTDLQEIMDEHPIYGSHPANNSELYSSSLNAHYDVPYFDQSQEKRYINPQISMLHSDFYLENQLDEMLKKSKPVSFGEHLLDMIDEKGYDKYSTLYHKAQIDRRLFHNIISNEDYQPKKDNVILFALALELSENEAKDFLSYAGYSFANTQKDQILLYCFRNHYYNIMKINGYLYDKCLPQILTIE